MVGVPGEECRSAIQLFEEQHLRERMWQGHGREPKRHLRLALGCRGQSCGAADKERAWRAEELRELRRAELASALVERDQAHAFRQRRGEPALVLQIDALHLVALWHALGILGARFFRPAWQPRGERDDVQPWHGRLSWRAF